MESKKAYINWTHPLHLHKKLSIGTMYYPHIVRDDDSEKTHWSIQFVITEENQKSQGAIDLKMLIDNYTTREYFNSLTQGTRFTLFEGGTEVAKGYITGGQGDGSPVP